MNVRKQPIKRWFYFDMVRSLASAEDREDAIIGCQRLELCAP
jgi:hypothetical protein